MATRRNSPCARRWMVVLALAVLAGCTTVPAPVQEMAEADRAVQAAAAIDAETLAPVAFEKARRKLEEARSALRAQQHERARLLAEQTVVDAEFARITAQAEETERTAAGLRGKIRGLGGPASQPMDGS
jgi:septal ring factor EnvC (AmiA/AmiB activator)